MSETNGTQVAEDRKDIGELMHIKINDILLVDRKRSEYGDIEDLAKDIRENGLYQPIVVRAFNERELAAGLDEGKRFKLVAGGRRFTAISMLLGWERIPALVRNSMDELFHRIIELNENLKRKQMTWDEEALAAKEIMQLRMDIAEQRGEKITQHEVARELNIHPATMTRNLQAAETIQKRPELAKAGSRKAAIRAGESADYAERRMSLSEVMDEQRQRIAQTFQNDIVTADARDFVRKIMPRSVDLVLTDPPFGIDYYKSGHKMVPTGSKGLGLAEYDDKQDSAFDLLVDLFPHWVRILRETGWLICFMGEEGVQLLKHLALNCCAEHCDYRQGMTEDNFWGEHTSNRCAVAVKEQSPVPCRFLRPEPKPWIWVRPNSRNRSRYPEFHPQNIYESIFVCNMGKGRLNDPKLQNVFIEDAEYGNERIHSHQKPIALAKKLVSATTHIGDTVVDTTFGSGALLAGAAGLARVVKGCELNPAMRGPALGLIIKHHIPAPTQASKQSHDRYLQAVAESAEGVDNFEEVEDNDGE